MPAKPAIELWLVDLERSADALAAMERATPRLAADERRRALRLGDTAERRHRLAAYTALRILLERAAGRGQRGRPLQRSRAGKPRLAGQGPQFSLSHTGGLALIGVAPGGGAIGVDLERARAIRVAPHRQSAICAAAAGLGPTPLPPASDAAFLQAWTRLEAFAKAQGSGLASTLAALGLRITGGHMPPPTALEAAARRLALGCRLEVRDVALGRSLYAAVALPAGLPAPRHRRFPVTRAALEALLRPASSSSP
jgi:4'-phosphopantetheinyl transferase